MRSLKARFENLKEKNPNWGSYITLAHSVKFQNFGRDKIGRWFYKLMPKEEYQRNEARGLISHLTNLSNTPEEHAKMAKFAL